MSFNIQKLHFSIIYRTTKIHFSIKTAKQITKKMRKKLFRSQISDYIPSKSGHAKLINNKIVKCGSVLCLDKENLFSINQRKSVKIQRLKF